MATNLIVAAGALVIEGSLGYPEALHHAIAHPVVWIGALIDLLDSAANREALPARARRIAGAAALAAVLIAALAVSELLQFALFRLLPWPLGMVVVAVLASSLIAQQSLYEHVAMVGEALERAGLDAGRGAVSHIVGRNPAHLDTAGVARAAIESLAENFSDAVVAPAFWCVMFGLPGIALYKAVNTANSMLGHRTPQHEWFGWAAARLDDLMNLPASRLSAFWLILAAWLHHLPVEAALRAVRRDAAKHRSPNAGWPEATMAGALGLRLAGPRVYGAMIVEDAWMGDGREAATSADIAVALALYRTACALQLTAIAVPAASLAVIVPG